MGDYRKQRVTLCSRSMPPGRVSARQIIDFPACLNLLLVGDVIGFVIAFEVGFE
jgi:hypothetical protein